MPRKLYCSEAELTASALQQAIDRFLERIEDTWAELG